MRFISWNVNGLRACMKKGFLDFFEKIDADFFAIQETKMNESQFEYQIDGYNLYWNSAKKAGYSGTVILAKKKPINVYYDFEKINLDEHNNEGRIITLEYADFFFVDVYVPNSQKELTRLSYRQEFDQVFIQYLSHLRQEKKVIVCGDFNVAHHPIDLKNPKSNINNAGFTMEERSDFSNLLESGFVDSYRYLYKERVQYSWWSYMFEARKKNIGWRIDYFLVSKDLVDDIKDAVIHDQILGSDHCPIELVIS